MRTLPDKAFDLAIVDPPYGLKASGVGITGGKKRIRVLNTMPMEWDIPPTDEYFQELFRVSKNQIICGGNYFNLPPCRCFVVWDKRQPWKTSLRANTCGHRSRRQLSYSVVLTDRNAYTQRRNLWRYTNISLRPLQSKATRFLTRI